MAPTTVTIESVTAPIAASRHARVRNIKKVTDSVDSSRVRAISSSHTTASAGSPSASSSAACARVDSTVSSTVSRIAPRCCASISLSALMTSLAHSRAMIAEISSPGGSTAAPG